MKLLSTLTTTSIAASALLLLASPSSALPPRGHHDSDTPTAHVSKQHDTSHDGIAFNHNTREIDHDDMAHLSVRKTGHRGESHVYESARGRANDAAARHIMDARGALQRDADLRDSESRAREIVNGSRGGAVHHVVLPVPGRGGASKTLSKAEEE